MKHLAFLFLLLCLVPLAAVEDVGTDPAPVPEVTTVETPEIVRILIEEKDITGIATAHDQSIFISLADGRRFQGTYVHAQAGEPWAQDADCFDILNLVVRIRSKRKDAGEELKWQIACE